MSFEQGQHKWAKYLTRALTLIRFFYKIMFHSVLIVTNISGLSFQIFKYWSFILQNICTYVTERILHVITPMLSLSLSLSLSQQIQIILCTILLEEGSCKPICDHLLKLLKRLSMLSICEPNLKHRLPVNLHMVKHRQSYFKTE